MSETKNTFFEYDGLTYIHVRQLSEEEDIEIMISRSPKAIWKNAIIEKPKNGDDYTQKDFYACSGTSGYELFYCIERGIFVTPVERGIINLSEDSIGERFLDELSAFKSQKNIREIIAGNRPLTFDETKDVALMKDISAVLEEGDVFTRRNETLGDVRVRLGNPEHDGLMHIIKRRMDSRLFHENLSTEQAVKETSAILFLALKNIDEAPATKETNGHYVLYKNGIKTCFGKDKNGRFVLSGFDFYNTKQEAADAIKSVTAQYGYAPEFLGIYAQVGAAYASLNKTIPQSAEKSTVTDNSEVLSQKIDDFLKNANLKSSEKTELILGTVGDALAQNAAENGLDIKGFSHSLDNFFVNHALKKHGNTVTEKTRGNVGITEEDIKSIPDILQTPDYLIYGTKTKTGNKAIVYAKNISGSTIFVEEIRNGRMKLAAQTLYKLPRTIDVSFMKNAPELYAHNDPGTIKIIDVKNEIVKNLLFKSVGEEKIKGTAYDSSPVEENPMTEHGSSPIFTIPQSAEKSTVTDNSEVLTKPMTITVNDKERTCRNGVLEGFKNAVKMVDELLDENKLLKEENAELHKKLEQKSHKKDRAGGWER